MRRTILIIMSMAALLACTKEQTLERGRKIGEIYTTAKSGSKTVLVKLPGLWRVSAADPWISLDVEGRQGEGAFTLSYSSNESDFISSNPTRLGRIVIEDYSSFRADTLYLRQQGVPDGKDYSSLPQNSYIEFVDVPLTRLKLSYFNLSGCADLEAAENLLNGDDADIQWVIWDNEKASQLGSAHEGSSSVYGNIVMLNRTDKKPVVESLSSPMALMAEIDGVCIACADFGEAVPSGEGRYGQLRTLLDAGYNRPDSPDKWIVGGSFYYLSVLELGYPSTPSWYPSNPNASDFEADRYARTNNLVDCIWMCSRDYNPTFSKDGIEWRADYIYASASAWNAAAVVSLSEVPLSGAVHKSMGITLKY